MLGRLRGVALRAGLRFELIFEVNVVVDDVAIGGAAHRIIGGGVYGGSDAPRVGDVGNESGLEIDARPVENQLVVERVFRCGHGIERGVDFGLAVCPVKVFAIVRYEFVFEVGHPDADAEEYAVGDVPAEVEGVFVVIPAFPHIEVSVARSASVGKQAIIAVVGCRCRGGVGDEEIVIGEHVEPCRTVLISPV